MSVSYAYYSVLKIANMFARFTVCACPKDGFRFEFEMLAWRVLVFLCLVPALAIGWWPFSSQQQELEEPSRRDDVSRKAATFEMMSAEQKFLNEAQQFLDLSPLDQCLHGVSLQRFGCCLTVYRTMLSGGESTSVLLW